MTALKGCDLTQYLQLIFSKLKQNQSISNMTSLIKALKENNKDLDLSKYIETIFGKIKWDSDNFGSMPELMTYLDEVERQKILGMVAQKNEFSLLFEAIKVFMVTFNKCKLDLNLINLDNIFKCAGSYNSLQSTAALVDSLSKYAFSQYLNKYLNTIMAKTRIDKNPNNAKYIFQLGSCCSSGQDMTLRDGITISFLQKIISKYIECNSIDAQDTQIEHQDNLQKEDAFLSVYKLIKLAFKTQLNNDNNNGNDLSSYYKSCFKTLTIKALPKMVEILLKEKNELQAQKLTTIFAPLESRLKELEDAGQDMESVNLLKKLKKTLEEKKKDLYQKNVDIIPGNNEENANVNIIIENNNVNQNQVLLGLGKLFQNVENKKYMKDGKIRKPENKNE